MKQTGPQLPLHSTNHFDFTLSIFVRWFFFSPPPFFFLIIALLLTLWLLFLKIFALFSFHFCE